MGPLQRPCMPHLAHFSVPWFMCGLVPSLAQNIEGRNKYGGSSWPQKGDSLEQPPVSDSLDKPMLVAIQKLPVNQSCLDQSCLGIPEVPTPVACITRDTKAFSSKAGTASVEYELLPVLLEKPKGTTLVGPCRTCCKDVATILNTDGSSYEDYEFAAQAASDRWDACCSGKAPTSTRGTEDLDSDTEFRQSRHIPYLEGQGMYKLVTNPATEQISG